MELRVIKSEKDYHAVLTEAERLVAIDPVSGTTEAERLELLTLLVEDYERRQFSFEIPDPIEAIEYRMQEQGLRQKDLVSLIGSKSRVSEILSRRRPLTVPMIRALSTGLGIPLESLISDQQELQKSANLAPSIDWKEFPIKEMHKRGWLDSFKDKMNEGVEEIIKAFLDQVEMNPTHSAMYRRNFKGEELDHKSYYSTLAWTARVLIRAKESVKPNVKFEPSKITPELLRDLAKLSWLSGGPRLAIEFLAKYGIIVIIEDRLPNTLLDGAAMMTDDGTPVIGLTLRYDRVDYFWFTLLHEVAHVWRHLNSKNDTFVDRIENMGTKDLAEKEANRIARDACIPRGVWKRSMAFLAPTKESIYDLANELHIHPAIVVGRLQFETNQYGIFRELLGQGLIKECFSEVNIK